MNREEKKRMKSVVCAGMVILAVAGCATAPAAIVTTTYEFIPDQSTVVVYGGWGGRFDYSIEGHFQLTVDFDAGIASFSQVDATISEVVGYYEEGEFRSTDSLGVLFHMTELESTYVSDAQIDFLLERNIPTFPGADIHIVLTFMDDSVHLTGNFGEPIVDGAWYDLDAVAIPEPATLYYVDADANGLNDGSSWADAYNYLQDALTVSSSGDEIWVAEGIYKPDEDSAHPNGTGYRIATFRLKNGVAIRGGYAGFGEPEPNTRDIDLYETILSGDLYGNDIVVNDPCDLWNEPSRAENCYHVVTGSGTDETAVLDGFTIAAGNAFERPWHPMVPTPNNWGGGMYNHSGSPRVTKCRFKNNSAEGEGGGIYNDSGSPTISNCIFAGNVGMRGGGMCNWESSPTLTNCMFNRNSARHGGGGMHNLFGSSRLTHCTFRSNTGSNGGGIWNWDSSLALTNCTFSGNSASWGGGIKSFRSSLTLTNCAFTGNAAVDKGGGMYNQEDRSLMIDNCIFSGNSAGERGGGLYNGQSNLLVDNCVFEGNLASDGGGIYSSYSSLALTNCTLAGNSGTNGNGVACGSYRRKYRSDVQATNCVLWDGGDEIWNNDGSAITVRYSDVQGGETGVYDPCEGLVWGTGNIDADPCFAEPGYWDPNGTPGDVNDDFWIDGDYHLLPDSPCIDAGDPNYPYDPNETDLDGKPRLLDGNNDGIPVIDMGAYEYSPAIPAEVRIVPRTINLTSKGKWITSLFWLPEDYDVADIDPNSVLLEGEIEAEWFSVDEQQQVAVARFSRSEVQGILNIGEVELTITGELIDGTVFEGTDVIRVIDKGGGK